MTATKTTPKTDLTPEHKAALAEGRAQGRIVRNYLDALESNKPKRGRPRPEAAVRTRLDVVNDLIDSDTPVAPVTRLQLLQERINLTAELERLRASDDAHDLEALTSDFTRVAKAYSVRKGLTKAAWRSVGVPASVLKQAGITG